MDKLLTSINENYDIVENLHKQFEIILTDKFNCIKENGEFVLKLNSIGKKVNYENINFLIIYRNIYFFLNDNLKEFRNLKSSIINHIINKSKQDSYRSYLDLDKSKQQLSTCYNNTKSILDTIDLLLLSNGYKKNETSYYLPLSNLKNISEQSLEFLLPIAEFQPLIQQSNELLSKANLLLLQASIELAMSSSKNRNERGSYSETIIPD